MLWTHRIVVVPPHKLFGVRVAHHELVLGAASGMHARVGDKGAMRGDLGLIPLQRVLVELRRAEVPVDRSKITETKAVRAEIEIMRPVLDHVLSVPLIARPKRMRANVQVKVCPRTVATIWRSPIECAAKRIRASYFAHVMDVTARRQRL
jgi:hypothetical protein